MGKQVARAVVQDRESNESESATHPLQREVERDSAVRRSYTDYDAGPDHEALAARYGLDFCKRGQAQKVQRLESEFGSEQVARWADEGMPVEAMGKPQDMQAFRKRKASRSAAIPDDVERQNQASMQRNARGETDDGPAGDAGAPDAVRNVISRPGASMDESVQREMESKMGGSFDDVRLHTGPEAADAAESINARAFTVGNHVAFNRGEYRPETTDGKRILAHELTHVRQQNSGRVSLLPKDEGHTLYETAGDACIQPALEVSSPADPAEREAEEVADAVVGMEASVARKADGIGNSIQTGAETIHRQSLDEQVEEELDAETSDYLLGVRASLPETELLSTDDFTLFTREATTVWVRLAESPLGDDASLSVEFMPNIGVETHRFGWPDGEFSSLRWSFDSQEVSSVRMNLGTFGVRESVGNAEAEINDEVTAFLKQTLPAPMLESGYNPYDDPEFESNIQSVADSFEMEAGGGTVPEMSDIQIYGSMTIEESIEHEVGEGLLDMEDGTRLTARIHLDGGLPGPDEEVHIDRATLEFDNSLNVRDASAMGTGLTVARIDSVTLNRGGSIDMEYRLVTEDLASIANNLQGIADGLGGTTGSADDFDEEHDGLREEYVEPIIETELEQMVRELVILHRHAIPEVDLADALGIDGTPVCRPPGAY